MSACEIHCTLKNLSNAENYCFSECKLRTISGIPGNGQKYIGTSCKILAEDLESIRIRLVNLTNEQLVEVINKPEVDSENNYNLRLGYWEFYNNNEE